MTDKRYRPGELSPVDLDLVDLGDGTYALATYEKSAGTVPTGGATSANQATALTDLGGVTETAPATDTASSGLNGRLQRIAQRLTSLIALLPASLGQKAKAASLPVVIASDQDSLAVKQQATTAAYAAISVGLTAVIIKATNAARYFITIHNNGTVPIYVGSDTSVTTSNGLPIPAGESKSFACTTDLYGISGTAAQDVRYFAETA